MRLAVRAGGRMDERTNGQSGLRVVSIPSLAPTLGDIGSRDTSIAVAAADRCRLRISCAYTYVNAHVHWGRVRFAWYQVGMGTAARSHAYGSTMKSYGVRRTKRTKLICG